VALRTCGCRSIPPTGLLRMNSLASRFAEADYRPIVVDGATVHPMLRLYPKVGDRVHIRWVSQASPRVQGLGVRLRLPDVQGAKGYGGLLRVNDVESPAIMLWTDTAPPEVLVECIHVDEGAELQISNRWRLENGREDEWFNNYGILIEERTGQTFLLRCSDGIGEKPTFDDLIVEVRLISGGR
jgi:hypothetical protein